MATRKLNLRTRTTSAVDAPLISSSSSGSSRPRSVLAKGRSELHIPVEDPTEQGHMESGKKVTSNSSDGGESHIQVAIRCRRRSEREIQEASPIIISTEGPKGQNITIETAPTTSILGIVTLPPTRTYPFDVVFGPEADQSMVYQDVVHPMLDEVVKGYNCTLFAYGQTGTGKTYTMQGDLALTPLGNPSAQAGMIPRALFKLFNRLEASGCDYSVKISYVELYNEELRDLLATELSAPSGSAQPMSIGGPRDTQSALKIFDDSSKRGVFIQGLEETPVKDFNDALRLLEKGSQRRQIAATKFNDHSSRSHSVFSITVHSKETSSLGDDLLKVGKLNLVDLAGSENIGRSGAENKRAREAGMINQSLLTLGRVINALVDKSSHVPYRESKLTRLLQDSLGGRTKTCIIATVSPARSNMEETLSTLDYALRAKSIRNKPEVNQRMSRNALLKEYVGEIERLKSDLLAAREKNGIYFSEETWTQLSNEHELRQTEVEESKKQVEIIESQMRSVREEFEQSIALLMKTDGELKSTKQRLQKREGELVEKENELNHVKVAFEEEVIVRKAHAATEDILDDVADSLKKVIKESTSDLYGLFNKIERKMQEFDANSKAIKSHSALLDSEARSFLPAVETFFSSAMQALTEMKALAESVQKKETSALASHRQLLSEQIRRIGGLVKTMQAKEEASDQNLTNISTIVKEVQGRLANELSIWSGSTQTDLQAMCTQIEQVAAVNLATAERAMQILGCVIDKLVKDAHSSLEHERSTAERQTGLVSNASRLEISRLKEQNAQLSDLLESERQSSSKAKDNLIKRISSLLEDFTEERDRGLREAALGIQEANTQAADDMEAFSKKYDLYMSESSARSRAWGTSLDKTAVEGGQARLSGTEALRSASTMIQENLSDYQRTTSTAIKTHSDGILHVSNTLNSCSNVFEREHKIKRARIESSTRLAEDAQVSYQTTQNVLDSTCKELDSFGRQLATELDGLGNGLRAHSTLSIAHVSSVQQHNQRILEQGTRQNPATGTTPQKRKWSYIENWGRTQSRSDLLREYHSHRSLIATSTATNDMNTVLLEQEPVTTGEGVDDGSEEQDVGDEDERKALGRNTDETVMVIKEDAESEPLHIPEISSSTSMPSEDPVPSKPAPVSIPAAPKLNRRESGIPKIQPHRPTLQEKSTNIIVEPRTRVTRMSRIRR